MGLIPTGLLLRFNGFGSGLGVARRHAESVFDTSEQIMTSAASIEPGPLGGSQPPKISFATLMADIARGQPA
jgi:hypothetical protein